MDATLSNRIRQLIDAVGLTPYTFGKQADVAQSIMSELVNDKGQVNADVLSRIVDTYPFIDANWLLTGKGEPFRSAVPAFEAPKRGPKAKAPAVLAAAGGDAKNRYFRPSMWTRG